MSTLITFLESIRPRLDAEPQSHVIVVTGNESADLDSFIASLTTAFFLAYEFVSTAPSPETITPIVLPFVSIQRQDLALRSDVEYVLATNKIDPNLLFFRDDLPRLHQVPSAQVSLFLVDHNKVADSMALNDFPDAKVVGIIDHHKDEGLYLDTANPRRIQVTGSCSTLVTDEYFHKSVNQLGKNLSDRRIDGTLIPDWAQHVARLLLGPILIDTQNLNPAMHKATPLDVSMANRLLPYTGWETFDDLFHEIDNARRDTSKLSTYDLLRKDYKEWTVHGTTQVIKVGISSVVGLLDKYVARDGQEVVQTAIEQWAQNRTVDLSLVLFSEAIETPVEEEKITVVVDGASSSSAPAAGTGDNATTTPDNDGNGENNVIFRRQILVNPVISTLSHFSQLLEKVPELQLERNTVADTEKFVQHGGRAYNQHNTALSRKQIWPIVEQLLTQLAPVAQL